MLYKKNFFIIGIVLTIILSILFSYTKEGEYTYIYGFPLEYIRYYNPSFATLRISFGFDTFNFILNILIIYFFLKFIYFILIKFKNFFINLN